MCHICVLSSPTAILATSNALLLGQSLETLLCVIFGHLFNNCLSYFILNFLVKMTNIILRVILEDTLKIDATFLIFYSSGTYTILSPGLSHRCV